jgi:polysaccharide export outer membrane protein
MRSRLPLRVLLLAAAALLAGLAAAQGADYTLGAGDVIKVTVFQNPDLTTETRVSEAGAFTFPLIGTVAAAGKSPSEVEREIARRLREDGFVNRPQVNVTVLQFKAIQVSVLGQVNKPGRYPLEQTNNRLTEVLATAGGVTTLGADVVTVITQESGKETRIEVDVPELIRSADRGKDVLLKNGDVVYVPRYPVFYIHGEVQRPGQYRVERGMTVQQALAVGGGLTLRGSQRGLQLTRREPAGALATREADLMEPVLSDDELVVKDSLF